MNTTAPDSLQILRTTLAPYLSRQQRAVLRECLEGEEAAAFQEIIQRMAHTVQTMPTTYQTDGQGLDAIAALHYFKGGADWYITEKDSDPDGAGQVQAFGVANLLGHGPKFGYISIAELVGHNVELDLHWTPKPLRQINPDAAGPNG